MASKSHEVPVLNGWAQISCRHCGEVVAFTKADTIPQILCAKCATNLFYGRES